MPTGGKPAKGSSPAEVTTTTKRANAPVHRTPPFVDPRSAAMRAIILDRGSDGEARLDWGRRRTRTMAATPAKTASAAPADHGLEPGDRLDAKYRIERQLGQGGMGAVYRATHLGTTRTVAVKVSQPRYARDPEFVARFRREAEAAGRLRHPNVVDVTDFGFAETPGGRVAYLVMEYLDGCTLAEVLAEEGRLPRDWVVDILAQACSAVDEAHRAGLIHRDLKPDNIWLEPNRRGGFTVKVLDFGLVKIGASTLAGLHPEDPGVTADDAPADARSSSLHAGADQEHASAGPEAAAPRVADAALTESPTLARPTPAADRANERSDAGD